MIEKEEKEYLRIGLAIAGIQCNDIVLDMIFETTKIIRKKKGKANIADLVAMRYKVDEKYQEPEIKDQIRIINELISATKELNGEYENDWNGTIEGAEKLIAYLKTRTK